MASFYSANHPIAIHYSQVVVCIHVNILAIFIGCLIWNGYSHPISVETVQTTVINLSEIDDAVTKFRAINDPEVAAVLKSFGITKVEDYIYIDNRRIEKHVSYTATVFNTEEAKHVIQKVVQVLPGMITKDDQEEVYSILNELIHDTGRQKRAGEFNLDLKIGSVNIHIHIEW